MPRIRYSGSTQEDSNEQGVGVSFCDTDGDGGRVRRRRAAEAHRAGRSSSPASAQGKGADFGGVEGADKHCQQLAQAAGAGNRTWRAYLSASGAKPVNAKDRIGAGPWQNAKGVVVATSVADLHSDNNKLSKENSLTEKGAVVNGRGDTPNRTTS